MPHSVDIHHRSAPLEGPGPWRLEASWPRIDPDPCTRVTMYTSPGPPVLKIVPKLDQGPNYLRTRLCLTTSRDCPSRTDSAYLCFSSAREHPPGIGTHCIPADPEFTPGVWRHPLLLPDKGEVRGETSVRFPQPIKASPWNQTWT